MLENPPQRMNFVIDSACGFLLTLALPLKLDNVCLIDVTYESVAEFFR